MIFSKKYFFSAVSLFTILTSNSLACSGGCGVLNVGTSSLMPNSPGGIAFLQYDESKQTRNWHKHKKSGEANHDKEIETKTITAGTQYMFNREFGAALRIPYITRYTKTTSHHDNGMGMEDETTNYTRHSSVGDITVNGIYSGFFADMSTGITFGLKLPTGSTSSKTFSRSSQIGTGSTDSIFGFYHRGNFSKESRAGYFLQTAWQRPFIRHQGFTPGYEISGSTGIFYNLGQCGKVKKIAPILQISATKKGQSSGWADPSHNPNSGYSQAYFAPGIELTLGDYKFYADAEFPIYRSVNGNQLVAQNLYKVILGYSF